MPASLARTVLTVSTAALTAISTASIPDGHDDLHGVGEVEGERPAGAIKDSTPAGVGAQRQRPRRLKPAAVAP